MPLRKEYLAFDLGAESGRLMAGSLEGDQLSLLEVHRFANQPVRVLDALHWDVLRLWQEMKDALARAAAAGRGEPQGIGLATWGVDYGLLDGQGELLGLPYHYRDGRTAQVQPALERHYSQWELYARTGMSFAPHNTLCQLLAARLAGSPALDAAASLLLMPGLFTFWLSGVRANDRTIAGSTMFHDLHADAWCGDVLERLGLPGALPAPLVPSGTVLGPLLGSVAEEVGLGAVPVIATAGHDTPAASSVVPSAEVHPTFISSGTWSVVGTELREPIIKPEGLARQFVVETAAGGRLILVHNSMGLWPLQECRREWQQEGHAWSYATLTEMAARARPLSAILDPDDWSFFQPGAMVAKVAAYCRRTGQAAPADEGATARTLLEGLALRYRRSLEDLETLTGWPVKVAHILGGGSRNALLCQFTADVTGHPVVAGPVEAAASGTVLLQALARGAFSSLEEVRELVARSATLVTYEPRPSAQWEEAYGRFCQIVS